MSKYVKWLLLAVALIFALLCKHDALRLFALCVWGVAFILCAILSLFEAKKESKNERV